MAACFPVLAGDQIVMVTDGGQLIRCPVRDISVVGRRTRGVTLFRVAADEHIVSVTRIREPVETDDGDLPDDTSGDTNATELNGTGEAAAGRDEI